jgi:alpha-N-arabinofuranosidase
MSEQQKAKITVNKNFRLSIIDKRIYGSFVEHLGSVIYNGIYEPGNPNANENGLRIDVLKAVKELGPTLIRYPGGNYVSGYNWEDTVGPVKERPTKLDYAWKMIEPNVFGLNEFYNWNTMIGSELALTLNLGTRGIDDARNFLEYCNFPAGSYYSNMRIKHGKKEPYNIKTWYLGNEMDGPWQIGHKTAREYGRVAVETAKVLRILDSDLKLIACGDSGDQFTWYPEYDREVLMEVYPFIDYISLHKYIHKNEWSEPTDAFFKPEWDTDSFLSSPIEMDQHIETIIALCDYVQSVKRLKKKMMISYDEWNVIAATNYNKPTMLWKMEGSDRSYDVYTMEEVLVFCGMLLSLIRHADRIKIACQSLLVNAGAPIIALENSIIRNGIFYPLKHAIDYGEGEVLTSVIDSPKLFSKYFDSVNAVDSIAIYNEGKDELVIFAINRIKEPVLLSIDARDFKFTMLKEHITMETKGDLTAMNTKENPFAIVPKQVTLLKDDQKNMRVMLPAYSWNAIRVTVR